MVANFSRKEVRKTTLTISVNLLRALHEYMAREGVGLHDQSAVINEALRQYLEGKGITVDRTNIEYDVISVTTVDKS